MQRYHQLFQEASEGQADMDFYVGKKTLSVCSMLPFGQCQNKEAHICKGRFWGGKQIDIALSQANKILNCYRTNTLS
jgi:hypothetical protein